VIFVNCQLTINYTVMLVAILYRD